jgi:hypothetical protein
MKFNKNDFELSANLLKAKANAQALTNADVKSIEAAGLRLVHRPTVKTNVVSMAEALEKRRLQMTTSPEAA